MNKIRGLWVGLALGVATLGMGSAAQAQNCGGTYQVQRGDTLTGIAERQYRNARLWSAIHQANIDQIGDNPERILAGMDLRLTCIDGRPSGLAGGIDVTVARANAPAPLLVTAPFAGPGVAGRINLVTADDYAPFTDRSLPAGGMFTEVVQHAMEAAAPAQGFAIHWVNDWSAHHEPLLSNAMMDVGFPWIKPDCDSQPDTYRCENLLFSDPMFEMLVLVFTNTARPMRFGSDADMAGKTLCRPAGWATFFFDHQGRNWLRDGVITLRQPINVDDCFEMLMAGAVDGVVINEFSGRQKIKALGLAGQVDVAAGRPIAIDGLHVVAHKDHPRAAALVDMVNTGLSRIKADGTYQATIDAHLTRIWADF